MLQNPLPSKRNLCYWNVGVERGGHLEQRRYPQFANPFFWFHLGSDPIAPIQYSVWRRDGDADYDLARFRGDLRTAVTGHLKLRAINSLRFTIMCSPNRSLLIGRS